MGISLPEGVVPLACTWLTTSEVATLVKMAVTGRWARGADRAAGTLQKRYVEDFLASKTDQCIDLGCLITGRDDGGRASERQVVERTPGRLVSIGSRSEL